MANETWKIRIGSPLLRSGITLEADVSGKYLVLTLIKALDRAREFNKGQNQRGKRKKR